MNTMFEQIEIEPAYRKVAAALSARILDRTLAAGDRLPSETELARQFGVNRSTVREALRELQNSGLLGRQRGTRLMGVRRPEQAEVAGSVSRALTLHDVTYLNVWEALTILEPSLAETAAQRRQDSDIQALGRACIPHSNHQVSLDTRTLVERVGAFFRCMAQATHNTALVFAQEPLIQLLEPSLVVMIGRVPQAPVRIAEAQGYLLKAITASNAEEARSWMAKHIRDFRRGYELAGISMESPVAQTASAG